MLRNRGGGASTGSLSRTGLIRTTEITRRSSSMARRKYQRRSPRLDPRATTMEKIAGRASRLRDVDVIAQFVRVARGVRKVCLQMLAGGFDGLDDAVGELAILEPRREARNDTVPEVLRHLLVDAAVSEDDEALLFRGDEEKHAVAPFRQG